MSLKNDEKILFTSLTCVVNNFIFTTTYNIVISNDKILIKFVDLKKSIKRIKRQNNTKCYSKRTQKLCFRAFNNDIL